MSGTTCPCSGLGSDAVTLVVDRPYYPSGSDRIERKKTALCPCACAGKTYKRPMTGEERIRMLKAKIAGNCCSAEECPGRCAWPANWKTR